MGNWTSLPILLRVTKLDKNIRPHTPMEFLGNHYYNLKNGIIKAERRLLKELGFCVHVKHPHKIVITYLQILEHEKNVALARKAWNYMNDSLRTDVFVRFSPETIACACIFLAARTCKVNLPLRPAWWLLFDASYDEIEDISLSILRLYSRPLRKVKHLEAIVNKIKKSKEEAKKLLLAKETPDHTGSFTPLHVPSQIAGHVLNNNNSSKPSSKTNSPVEKYRDKRNNILSSVVASRKTVSDNERKKDRHRRRGRSESDESSDISSDSGTDLPSKKYAQQRKQYEKKKRAPSSDSDGDRRTIPSKIRRSVSPVDNYRKIKPRENRDRKKESNGQYVKKYDSHTKSSKRRSRSRSPVKRSRSISPATRKDKYLKEKGKIRSMDKYDKYGSKIRR